MRTRMTAEQKNARREARRNAREAVFTLLFETEYHEGETPEAIYDRAVAASRTEANARPALPGFPAPAIALLSACILIVVMLKWKRKETH